MVPLVSRCLNFYKDEITSLDYLETMKIRVPSPFTRGETGLYRISWSIRREILCGYFTGQNGMWYRMNASGTHEYLLEAKSGMAIKVIAYRTNFDSLHSTINRFCIKIQKRRTGVNRSSGLLSPS